MYASTRFGSLSEYLDRLLQLQDSTSMLKALIISPGSLGTRNNKTSVTIGFHGQHPAPNEAN